MNLFTKMSAFLTRRPQKSRRIMEQVRMSYIKLSWRVREVDLASHPTGAGHHSPYLHLMWLTRVVLTLLTAFACVRLVIISASVLSLPLCLTTVTQALVVCPRRCLNCKSRKGTTEQQPHGKSESSFLQIVSSKFQFSSWLCHFVFLRMQCLWH